MGGGTPLLEANRLGCDVTGWDINPMAYWIVGQEIRHLDLDEYRRAADDVGSFLQKEVGHLYLTRCEVCRRQDALVKYFLWVKTLSCRTCRHSIGCWSGPRRRKCPASSGGTAARCWPPSRTSTPT